MELLVERRHIDPETGRILALGSAGNQKSNDSESRSNLREYLLAAIRNDGLVRMEITYVYEDGNQSDQLDSAQVLLEFPGTHQASIAMELKGRDLQAIFQRSEVGSILAYIAMALILAGGVGR